MQSPCKAIFFVQESPFELCCPYWFNVVDTSESEGKGSFFNMFHTHHSGTDILKYTCTILHLNTIDIGVFSWTFPLSATYHGVFLKKMPEFPQKYSLFCVSVVCSMNLTYCIPVLHVILNTTMKPPLRAKKHVSFICNFPLRKLNVFSTRNTPTNYGGILEK